MSGKVEQRESEKEVDKAVLPSIYNAAIKLDD